LAQQDSTQQDLAQQDLAQQNLADAQWLSICDFDHHLKFQANFFKRQFLQTTARACAIPTDLSRMRSESRFLKQQVF
jgi:hypothetical protein